MAQGDDAVAYCRAQIGKPYVWATAGPNTFDCSGLVFAAYRAIKPPVYLGRTTYEQIFNGKEVTKDNLAVGDLIFPYSDISHVQIYAGGGKVIEAPNKDIPVRETNVTSVWRARRVGSVSGGDGGEGGSFLDDVPIVGGLLDAGEAAKETAVNTAKVLRLITAKTFWLRVGTVTVGGILILWGIAFLNRGLFYNTFNSIRQAGKDALGGAVQGYTFGLGATATGGLGGGTTVVNPPAPRTPKPPPAIAPKTAPVSPFRTTATVGRQPQPIPRPSGLSDAEFIDRLSYRVGNKKTRPVPKPHSKKVSEGGDV